MVYTAHLAYYCFNHTIAYHSTKSRNTFESESPNKSCGPACGKPCELGV